MKFKKSSLLAIMAVIMIVGLSSCNRGVGCPSDFSLLDPLAALLQLF